MKHHQLIATSPIAAHEAQTQVQKNEATRYWIARVVEVVVVATLAIAAVGLVGCKDAGKMGGTGSSSGGAGGSAAGGGAAPPAMPSDTASAPPNTAPKP